MSVDSIEYKLLLQKIRKLSRRQKKLLLLGAFFLIAAIFIFLFQARDTGASSGRCQSAIQHTTNSLKTASTVGDIDAANKLAQSNKTCGSKGLLVINETKNSKLSRLQYQHDKAVAEYALGKYDTAKKDASEALRIASQLDSNSKKDKQTLKNVQDLKYIEAGTY
jgi:hypothetical protein